MEILKRTPRTDMNGDAIRDKMATFHEKLAEELGIPVNIVDGYLVDFARLSSRVIFESGEIDFALANARDTAQQIAENFIHFIDTSCMETVEMAEKAIADRDRPVNALHPTNKPEGESESNFPQGVVSGQTDTAPGSEKKRQK